MSSLSENPQLSVIGEVIAFYDDDGYEVDPYSDDATSIDVRYAHRIVRHGWGRRPGWRVRSAVRHAVEIFNQRMAELGADMDADVSQCSDSERRP